MKTSERSKRDTLRGLIEAEDLHTAIIFCNRKTTVRELAKSLQRYGYKAGEIQGDMDQSSRTAELDRFKAGTINILVASDAVSYTHLDVYKRQAPERSTSCTGKRAISPALSASTSASEVSATFTPEQGMENSLRPSR